MRKISANYVFPVSQKPIKNGLIEVDEEGKIMSVRQMKGEEAGVEFYSGVIVPGFVNAHCHLELSQFKGKLSQGRGLPQFIKEIVNFYMQGFDFDISAIQNADEEMYRNGIVCVGDISKFEVTAEIKKHSKIYYHTFLEGADFFSKESGEKNLNDLMQMQELFDNVSFYAHAPYTCSVGYIRKLAKLTDKIFAIHNQEDASENDFYKFGKGALWELVVSGREISDFKPTGKTSLMSFLPEITSFDKNILLVHNLFTSEDEIEYAESRSDKIYWVLNPLSNRYISEILPDAHKFRKHNAKICLGTDSLASNTALNILEEMKVFTDIEFEEVLQWATINGAKALFADNWAGSIETGKKPGLNLITNFDFKNFKLTEKSQVKKLV